MKTALAADSVNRVAYRKSAAASVIAESYSDIFGLVMISNPGHPGISIETKSTLGVELGRNAVRFRKNMRGLPGFDAGSEEMLARFSNRNASAAA